MPNPTLDGAASSIRGNHTVAQLLEIAAAINSPFELKAVLKTLTQRTAQLCGVDRCSIFLWRDNLLIPAMAQYADGQPRPREWESFKALGPYRLDDVKAFYRALSEDRPVLVEKPGTGSSELIPAQWEDLFGLHATLVFPLFRGDRIVGVMYFDNCVSLRPFDEADLDIAKAIAAQIALLIDNARLVEETRSRLAETQTMLSIASAIGSTLDLLEVARRISRAAAVTLGADSAGIFLTRDDSSALEPLAGYHVPKQWLEFIRGATSALHGLADLDAALEPGRRSVWSDDVPTHRRFQHPVFQVVPMQSIVATPIRARGKLLGVLVCVWWQERHCFKDKELCLIEGIADQAAIAIVNARLYAKAEELAVQRERVRMAEELHDRLSQGVFSIGLTLDWCLHHAGHHAGLRARLQQVKREATLILGEMRQLIYRLSPEAGLRSDFTGRFCRLVDNFRELSGLSVEYTVHGDLARLKRTPQEVLLKTYQEGFANIVKHSSASHVVVMLDAMASGVRFELADDGVGIRDLARGNIPGGVGLTHMIRRIEDLGGRVALRPNVPSGLVVAGLVPLANHD